MKYKTIDDVTRAMLKAFPNAQLERDNCDQLVIYTNLVEGENGVVREMTDADIES